MRLPHCLPGFSWLVLLAVAIATPAAAAQDIFVTPIPNVPFSGVINVERSYVQPDGSIVNFRTIREIDRDSRGRIHNESRVLVPALDTNTPPVVRIHLYDPQTRISTMLDPQKRTFWTETVSHPPSTVPPAPRYGSAIQQGSLRTSSREKRTWAFMSSRGCSRMGFARLRLSLPRMVAQAKRLSLRMNIGTQMISGSI